MQRIIKFRQAIFHPITGEFVKWHYWGSIDRAFVGVDTGWYSPIEAIENSYQYTGLKDSEGVEEYFGDIIEEDDGTRRVIEDETSVVAFRIIGGKDIKYFWHLLPHKVIGNILEIK